ncbi:choline kinase [Vibrio sp. SCSIO 43135]|uniref:phosphotransferase family protein n=1 Tax=Vibrio sp. SCSIO 43135 TaxID=2819096 RepID=UPI002075777D|nr:phosphotransferase [Vibrio sp. SCSIO 43135]USD42844.1 choline kinase [Vibrio sp. SCSIO 43135]
MGTQDLSKMGAARVSIESIDGVDCVLKQGASPVEVGFYQYAAPNLVGVNSPELLKADGNCLYIEYIPHQIPLSELRMERALYAQLASLHRSDYVPTFTLKNHQWSVAETELALQKLNLPSGLESSVKRIQSLSSVIFDCDSLISGDSNDGNWGRKNSGELVLFDWERFGYGSPAIDLAPLVQGLGHIPEYKRIIDQYTQHNSQYPGAELLKHLVIAKCWIIVEVVNILSDREKPDLPTYINWYKANIPKWLDSVEGVL